MSAAGTSSLSHAPAVNAQADAAAFAASIEQENTARIRGLLQMGVPMPILEATAAGVRLEMVVSMIPDDTRPFFDAQFEQALATELDALLAEMTRPKLVLPGS